MDDARYNIDDVFRSLSDRRQQFFERVHLFQESLQKLTHRGVLSFFFVVLQRLLECLRNVFRIFSRRLGLRLVFLSFPAFRFFTNFVAGW